MLSTIFEGSVKDLRDTVAVAIARVIEAMAAAAATAATQNSDDANNSLAVVRVIALHEGEVVIRLLQPAMLPQVRGKAQAVG